MAQRERWRELAATAAAWWVGIRDSLWFLPAVLTLAAMGLAALTLTLDRALEPGRIEHVLFFGGGAEGARGVLGSIAGSIITVTGVIFSITIIALQLASSQYTPRVLRNFTADRGNQLVLGVLIATFTYTLLVLRAVQGEGGDTPEFVPSLSVTVAVVLALVSVGFVIFFISHVSSSIQASELIDRVTADALGLVDRMFPAPLGEPMEVESIEEPIPAGDPGRVEADRAGYLQAVDENALFDLADRNGLTVVMEVRIGEFVLPGTVIASVWPEQAVDDDLREAVRAAFVQGSERNLRQDLELAIVELVDIAVKALSPSINDPTTAMNCMDRLGEVFVALGRRRPAARWRTDAHGRLRFLAHRPEFAHLVGLAFSQLRHHGGDDPAIVARMLFILERVAELVPARERQAVDRQRTETRRAAPEGVRDAAAD